MTASSHKTGTGTHVSANDHSSTGGGQKSASTLIETASGHSRSESEPYGPGSGPKTATKTAETTRGQMESVKGPGESALIHETVNDLWSKRVTRETEHATQETTSGHDIAHAETPRM